MTLKHEGLGWSRGRGSSTPKWRWFASPGCAGSRNGSQGGEPTAGKVLVCSGVLVFWLMLLWMLFFAFFVWFCLESP